MIENNDGFIRGYFANGGRIAPEPAHSRVSICPDFNDRTNFPAHFILL